MRLILDELVGRLELGEAVVIGGVVRASGSVPRRSGARMLVGEDGLLLGSVGGGMVEGACHGKAKTMLASGREHELVEFRMQQSDAAEAGMVCGGIVEILLQRLDSRHLELFRRVQMACRLRNDPVLLTFLHEDTPPRMTLLDEDHDGLVTEELRTVLTRRHGRESFLCPAGNSEVLVEPLVQPGVVHLFGAGHVAQATAHLAALAGFEVVVLDDREEFAGRERYPDAREVRVLASFDDCMGDKGAGDYVVIVTRGHLYDRDVLAQALRTDAGYIGMIGSKKKRKAVFESLLADGFTDSDLERVYCPIGLSIGAETPSEIGFSIVAELIGVRAGRGEWLGRGSGVEVGKKMSGNSCKSQEKV